MAAKKLYRSRDKKMIAGVCGGIAEYLNRDASLVRILLVIAILLPGPNIIFFIAYLVMWGIVPKEPMSPSGNTDVIDV